MSNSERQRQFQLGNPGYDARRKARERSAAKQGRRAYIAKRRAAAEAERAAALAAAADPQLLLFPAMRPAA